MGIVLGVLADLGYRWCYRVLDAQYFGVAQRRRRVFIVGCAGDARAAAAVLLESESCDGDLAPSRAAGERVAPTLEAGANSTGGTRPPGTTVDTADSLIPVVAHSLRAQGQLAHREDIDTLIPMVARCLTCSNERIDGETETFVPVVDPPAVRRLMPVECERLQGFPDGWTDGETDSARYRLLGNAVCVPVAEWIGARLLKVMEVAA
jgi:DNA (cytosine-5)-methyltransferase 1